MSLELYEVSFPGGRTTLMRLSRADAERLGAKPAKANKAAAPRSNKQRSASTKQRGAKANKSTDTDSNGNQPTEGEES